MNSESFCARSGSKVAKSWLRTNIKSPVGAVFDAFADSGTRTVTATVAAAKKATSIFFLDAICIFQSMWTVNSLND